MGVTMPRRPFIDSIAALSGVFPEDIKLNHRSFHLDKTESDVLKLRLRAIIDETCKHPGKHPPAEIDLPRSQ